MENHPKFSYAVIPSYILDDDTLDEGAKNLYARISMYSQEGRCWASNQHFADKQKVTTRCIQKWLVQLKDAGYIEIEIEKTGFQTKRNIWISSDFKKMFTKRTTVRPGTNHSSPRHEPQFTQIIDKETINKTTTSAPSVVVSPKKIEEKAASHEKTFSPPRKDFLKVCDTALKDIQIPEVDKIAICKRFDAPTIEKAVKAYLTQVQHVENPVAWLIAACKGKYEPTLSKEDKIKQNKTYAEKILHSLIESAKFKKVTHCEITNGISNFEIQSSHVDIHHGAPEGNCNILYDDNQFKEKLHEALRKHRFE